MKLRQVIGLLLLLITLAAFGCAGMNNLQTSTGEGATMMGCNGDLPSPYPPYCRPVNR